MPWIPSLRKPTRKAKVAEGRPPDDRDAAVEIASRLSTIKGEATTWLTHPRYGPLLHRIESAHASVEAAAVEARRRVRLDEGE